MSLSFQIPWYTFLLAAALGIGASFYLYRATVPPVPSFIRYLLTGLRGLALTLMVLAFCQPVLRVSGRSPLKPEIAVLVDNSLSMSLTDGAGSREQVLRSIVAGKALEALSSSARIDFFAFSPSLHPVNIDSLRLDGSTTDIASAFRLLKNRSVPQLKAVLLLSDGNYNTGENPLDEAERTSAPIFCAGIGDSSEQKDVAVQKLLTNSVAYVHSSVPLDATITVSGFEDRKLPVVLLEDGKQIDQQFIILPPSSSGVLPDTPFISFLPRRQREQRNIPSALPRSKGRSPARTIRDLSS